MALINIKVGDRLRTITVLKTRVKNTADIPKGTEGTVVFCGDHAITVDFHNIIYGKWSISHSIAERILEQWAN